jgi:hypothetical protein
MERRYYLAKLAVVIVAVALAAAGSGMGTTKVAHSVGATARYGAAAQVEAAAWHATAAVGHVLAQFFATTMQAMGVG